MRTIEPKDVIWPDLKQEGIMDLFTVLLREDPDELVVWSRDPEIERPIAYLNRADASREEFLQLRGHIERRQFLPNLKPALEGTISETMRQEAVIEELSEALRDLAAWVVASGLADDFDGDSVLDKALDAIAKTR